MAVNDVAVIVLTATPPEIGSPPCPSQVVTHQNTAQVSTDTTDAFTENNNETVDYTVSPNTADLSISKSKAPNPVAEGEDVVSTINVTNNGPLDTSSPVEVSDDLSPWETYVSYSGTDWSCTHSGGTPAGGTVDCTYTGSELSVGEVIPELTITTNATGDGDPGTVETLTNNACVGASGDLLSCNNCGSGEVISTHEFADLVVVKNTSNDHILITEDSFTYTVTVHNNGDDTAEIVDFRDTIPQYAPAGTGTPIRPATTIDAITDQGTCNVTDALVHCNLEDIVNGQTVTITITVTRPMKDGTYTNTASAYSTLTGDRDRSNNHNDAVVTVDPVTDIEVTRKTVTYSNHPNPVLAGTIATYTIDVRNNGPSNATTVQLADVFDETNGTFTFISSSVAGDPGDSCTFDDPTRTLNCDLSTMPSATTKSITVVIRPDHQAIPPSPWQIQNTATISMDPAIGDSNTLNNEKDLILPIIAADADLAIEKNESPGFSEPVRYYEATPGADNYLVYEIVISNRGPSLATGVTFVDNVLGVFPYNDTGTGEQLEFIRDTENSDGTPGAITLCTPPGTNPFTVDGSSQDITCLLANDPAHPLGELESGEDYTQYLVFQVEQSPNPLSGDVFQDEVTVSGNEADNNPANNTEDEGTTVRTVVDLELEKTGPAWVEVEESFNFVFTVTNHGNGDSPVTKVIDDLPSDTELTGTPVSSVGTCTGVAGNNSFECNLGTFANGDVPITITVPVKITAYPASGSIINTATVNGQAPEPDPDLNPNSDDHEVHVHEPATLGDRVWLDANANGIQDNGEDGISGVVVNLLDNTGVPVLDPAGQPMTTTTNSSGNYGFTINHTADYRVEFIKPDPSYLSSLQDAGGDDTADSDAAGNGQTGLVAVVYGADVDTVDAGMYQLLSLGNLVWNDDNANGIQDTGERGIPNVEVILYSPGADGTFWTGDDVQVGVDTTDVDGAYLFTDLEPGDYAIQITPPAWVGYLPSPVQTLDPENNANNDSNISSSPSAGVYRSGAVTLASGSEPTNDGDADYNSNLSLDFALLLPGSIGNYIWLDENSDGIQDAGESGIANVTVQLKDSGGNNIATTVTDTHGGYLFTGLTPGDYFVEVVQASLPAGMSQTTTYTNQNADFGNQNQSVGHGYSVAAGQNLTADFGYNWSPSTDVTGGTNTGALGDRVWIDHNSDGVQDASEVGVSGVELTLYDADDVLITTTTTDASGNYIFDGLSAGAYYVEVTDDTGASHAVLSGDYSQTGDPDHFAADSSTAPSGTAGDNRSTRAIILAPGDTFVNADFGYHSDTAVLYTIGDTVWADADRDGIIDAEESGIAGVTIALQDSNGNFAATTTTGANGDYLFTDLPAGEYTVVVTDTENILAGYSPTYDYNSGTVNPDGESTITLPHVDNREQNFGYVPDSNTNDPGLIGDTIFLDRDGDNTFDTGEGIEGVRIILRDSGNTIVAVTYTDANGTYLFGGLAADTYTVTVDTGSLPAGVSNTVDPDGGNNSTSTVNLNAGDIDLDQDFGYTAANPGSIGDLVWKDTNADGVYQANGLDGTQGTDDDETPFAGVSLDLYLDSNQNGRIDSDEQKIGSATTDASGNYLFEGLPAGAYNVKVTDTANILTGFWHSWGTDDTNNNSQADSYSVTLPADTAVLTADFAYYVQPGTVGDRVWKDVNVNGVYDAGTDTALAGVTVNLAIQYPDNTTVTISTVTDAGGLYFFPNLLLDENYNGIGVLYGNTGDEPLHTISVDSTNIPAGLISIYASRGSNTDSTTVGGSAADEDTSDMGSDNPAGEPGYPPMGSSDITNDFGYFEPGSIGEFIWHDMDNDGVMDGGEALNNVTVRLTPPADIDLGSGLGTAHSATTNASGHYLFEGLPKGSYTVTVDETDLPPALQVAGSNTIDPDGGKDSTARLTLAVGEDNLVQDFAYFVPGSIGNYVWDDTNGNGLQDGSESGHQGIRVHLLDGSGSPVDDPLHPGTPYIISTGAAGEYLFENLIPGTYQVQFILPAGTLTTSKDSGVDDTIDSDPDTTGLVTGIVLGVSESDLTVDAGLIGPAINIEKSTNTVDADVPPGVSLNVNDAITWTYLVKNTGSVTLTQVQVADDKIGVITCPQDTLLSGASMTCTASGTAVAGQYVNIGSVIGSPPTEPAVIDSDPSHYLAETPAQAVDIEKSTNGLDADTGTGPIISIGDPVNWVYLVSNTGNVALTNVSVTDNMGVAVSCPKDTLALGESITCTASGVAVAGQYENIGAVVGTPSGGGSPVTDIDYSHYYGSDAIDIASVTIEKATNGVDADTAPGPYAETGHTITWTYEVMNTGNVDLHDVTVSDDQIADTDIHCPDDGNTDNRITLLPIGASANCTATDIATAGAYENTGSVIGTPPFGPDVTDTDPSHYFGDAGSIGIEKATNGKDSDTEPGSSIRVKDAIAWTYVVTNTGHFPLSNVTVTDDQGVTVNCPKDNLTIGENMTCTGNGLAVAGQYKNIGSVTGVTPQGEMVQDTDPSHYFGKSFNWIFFYPAITPRCPPIPDYCYLVADGDNMTSTNSPLFKYTFATDSLEMLNRLGTDNVEAITLSLDGKTLYAADNGVFGIIDPTPGIANSFIPIEPGGVGLARGALGIIDIKDIDGMSFNPKTGTLYGSVRNGDGQADELDLLIKIDPKHGTIIDDAFATGVDYVIINTAAENASDVDDIAIDSDGTLFGIAGNSGGGGGDQLIKINKKTGAVGVHGPLNYGGTPIQDMEGLTLYNTRVLYGATGYEFTSEGTDNTLYKIDKASGKTVPIARLDQNFNGYVPGDFEAITCFPICK